MKKATLWIVLILITLLAACSSNEQEEKASSESQTEDNAQEETEEQGINVDKGLLSVEVTLPASLFDDGEIDNMIAEAKADGIDEVTENEDGSLTYKMSKSRHKELMKELETSLTETMAELKNSEDFVSIQDVTYDKSFSEFTLLVDKEAYENSFDAFSIFGIGISGVMYQLFNGADPEDYKVTIFLKDAETQEVFDEVILPDALENIGETE